MGQEKKVLPIFGAESESNESFTNWMFKFEAYAHKKGWNELMEAAEQTRKGLTVTVVISGDLETKNKDMFYDIVLHTDGAPNKLLRATKMKGNGVAALVALYEKYVPSNLFSKMQTFADLASAQIGADETDVENFAVKIDNLVDVVDSMASTKEELVDLLRRSHFLHGLRGRANVFDSFTTAMLIQDTKDSFEEIKAKAGEHLTRKLDAQKKVQSKENEDGDLALMTGDRVPGRKTMTAEQYAEYKKKRVCYKCGKPGHVQRECRAKAQESSHGITKGMIANLTIEDRQELIAQLEKDDLAFMTGFDELAMLIKKDVPQIENTGFWIIDPASTAHITNNLNDYLTFTERNDDSSLGGFGNGMSAKIEVVGNCPIGALTANGISKMLSVTSVKYVPSLRYRILSGGLIVEHGGRLNLDNSHSSLTLGKQVFPLFKVGKFFLLRTHNRTKYVQREQKAIKHEMVSDKPLVLTVSNKDQVRLWHRRLAHVATQTVVSASQSSHVRGIPKMTFESHMEPCGPCTLSKSTRASFAKSSHDREARGDRAVVHSDVWGPTQTPSFGGKRYAISFICTQGRNKSKQDWTVVNFAKTKDEVNAYLNKYAAEHMDYGGYFILISDNGGEYSGELIEKTCLARNVRQEKTNPYTPEENAIAERRWRTLADMMTAMLQYGDCDFGMWCKAMETAVYILNRLPSKALNGMTPFEARFGYVASLNHLRIFGCPCWVYIPKERRRKADVKSEPGIFVGFGSNPMRLEYHVLVKVGTKYVIRRSRAVTFDENWKNDNKNTNASPPTQDTLHKDVIAQTSAQTHTDADSNDDAPDFDSDDNSDDDNINNAPTTAVDAAGDSGGSGGSGGNSDLPASGGVRRSARTNAGKPPAEFWRNQINLITTSTNVSDLVLQHSEDDVCCVTTNDITNPTYKQSLHVENKEEWEQARQNEYNSMLENKVWDLVPDEGQNVIKGGWVQRTKFNSDGTKQKCKARFVGRGNFQIPGVDYEEVFAPVARYSSLREIMANGSKHMHDHPDDYDVDQEDVDTAFLYANIDEEVYIEQPQGFEKRGPNGEKLVCKLNKSLYGLKQSPRNWNKSLHSFLTKCGLVQSVADPCMYIKPNGDPSLPPLVVLIYVDDIIIAGMKAMRESFKIELQKRYKTKKLGRAHWCLGIEINFDINPERVVIKMSQSKYINDMIEKYGMSTSSPMSTPRTKEKRATHETDDMDDMLQEDNNYRSIAGSLMYAGLGTRPDIAEAVSFLTRSMQRPTNRDLEAAKRVIRYLKGTVDRGLLYSSSGPSEMYAAADADWAGDAGTARSIYYHWMGHHAAGCCDQLDE